ncbi:hypothetical protein Q3G72_024107 [Acer saccharum]|nr:hypothetical protein Q3G72_024107 [Acer saccharum]
MFSGLSIEDSRRQRKTWPHLMQVAGFKEKCASSVYKVFVVREGVMIHNPKTDSKSKFRGPNTAEERKRSSCSMECLDHMFYVELIVCIICIHMITLGSSCKMHEVLVRVGRTRIAKQEVLSRVGRTQIGKQGVMTIVGRTQIVMHGRLPRGMSAFDRELVTFLVGLSVWIDIDSKRAGYIGCICTLKEFLIYHRCWFCMLSNIWWLRIIEGFRTFQ